MTARAAAAVPFAKAAGLLAELAGVGLAVKRVERSAEAAGAAAGRHQRRGRRDLLPPGGPGAAAAPVPDMLYIAVDGTGVPWCPLPGPGRKGQRRRARTREAKVACLFTQTSTDDDGLPVRDPGSSTYLATFEPAERFGQLVDAEARRRGSEHIRQLVVLGDGAAWIWNLADELLSRRHPDRRPLPRPRARPRTRQPRRPAARGHREDWLAARIAELDTGDIDAVIAAGRDLSFTGSLARERDKALGYFKPTPTACATSISASSACSSAPAPSKPAAKPSSASD